MEAEQTGSFPATDTDAAERKNGAVEGQGNKVGIQILPGNPAVAGEGKQGVLPRFADIQKKVCGAGSGESGGRQFEGRFKKSYAAELLIVDGSADGGVFAADGAGGIAAEFKLAEAGAQQFGVEKTAEEGLAGAG